MEILGSEFLHYLTMPILGNILGGGGGGPTGFEKLFAQPAIQKELARRKELQESIALADARKKQRRKGLARRGRRASILTSGLGVLDELNLNRPQARAAQFFGG